MANVVVGSMTVDLVSRTAAFQDNMGKAAQSAKSAFADMKASAESSGAGVSHASLDVRHSIGLLDNTIRGAHGQAMADLVRMFAQSEVVMTALPIAATAAGFVLFGGIVYELYQKFQAADEANQKFRASLNALGLEGQTAIRKVDENILGLQAAIDDLNGNHLQAFIDRLKEIDNTSLDKIRSELDALQEKAAIGLAGGKSSAIGAFFGDTSNAALDPLIAKIKAGREQIDKLAVSGNNAGILAILQGEIQATEQAEKFSGISLKSLQTMQAIKDSLDQQVTEYTKLNEAASKEKEKETDAKRNADAQADLNSLKQHEAQFQEEIAKSAANTTMELYKQLAYEAALKQAAQEVTASFKPQTPLYDGSQSALTAAKIQTDQAFAIQQQQQVLSGIESENEKYQDQANIIESLYANGYLNDSQVQKALEAAKEKIDDSSKSWKELGGNIGDVLQQAILMKSGWHDALSAIALDIGLAIAKMEILNALAAEGVSSKSGGVAGGIFSFFSGLLSHHATGGTVPSGGFGIAGENGPELVYGGTSGVSVIPVSSGRSDGPNITVIYQTDARGADLSILQRLPLAMKQVEDRAVARASIMMSQQSRRTL